MSLRFTFVTPEFESFPSDISREKLCNLVCVVLVYG